MNKILSFLSLALCITTMTYGQNQQATIKIEKSENGETTIIEKEVELTDGKDINEILQELGVLDDLGNLKEGQSFEINVKKIDRDNVDQDIKIEYFDFPDFDIELESKAFLGVMLSQNEEGNGVFVQEVIEGTQAEKVGMQDGDVILELNGITYNSVGELVEAIGAMKAGDTVNITFLRNNELQTLEVDLGEKKISPFEMRTMPYFELAPDQDGSRIYEFHMDEEGNWPGLESEAEIEKAFLGISAGHECDSEEQGILIGRVSNNSAAEEMGIQGGDRLIKIFKQEITDFDQVIEIIDGMQKDDEIKLVVLRDGKKVKMSGVLGSRFVYPDNSGENGMFFRGHPGHERYEGHPSQREFYFKYDGNENGVPLDGLEEQLEEMMRSFENQLNEDFDQEQFERDLEEMLEPMLENMEIVTNEINISITVESITEEDMESVNENADLQLSDKDDLGFDFINFFPNPNNGEFNLRFKLKDPAPYRVLVYNQIGKTVFEDMRSTEGDYRNTIDLNSLAKGPYFLLISQGNKTYSRKIIKE